MDNKLILSQIYIGNTDAKNELLYGDQSEVDDYKNNFVIPPSLIIDDFKSRKKYFITGLKGTGKTAFLRYVDISMSDDDMLSKFILFKTEIDDEIRANISRMARIELCEDNSNNYKEDDFEIAWRWFVYRKILSFDAFENDEKFKRFNGIIKASTSNKKTSWIFPIIKRGMIDINISKMANVRFDLEFSSNGNQIKFSEIVRELDNIFCKLKTKKRINLFFDELELSYNTHKQYKKDAKLIRDLIVSIEKINAISKGNGLNICLYAAIRSEVLHTVESLGKEINKPISDFGIEILWNRPGVSTQPLLSIIEQRINNSRKKIGLPELNSKELWSEYFPNNILAQEPQTYILHNSWYRPRDIIRLLKIAQEQFPTYNSFSTNVLESIRKKYSSDSWIEMSEELKAKYSSEEIDAIRRVFYGTRQIWSIQSLKVHIKTLAESLLPIKKLIEKHDIESIFDDLYRIGIVGNINQKAASRKMRFVFRGDSERILNQDLYIHNALRAYLSV